MILSHVYIYIYIQTCKPRFHNSRWVHRSPRKKHVAQGSWEGWEAEGEEEKEEEEGAQRRLELTELTVWFHHFHIFSPSNTQWFYGVLPWFIGIYMDLWPLWGYHDCWLLNPSRPQTWIRKLVKKAKLTAALRNLLWRKQKTPFIFWLVKKGVFSHFEVFIVFIGWFNVLKYFTKTVISTPFHGRYFNTSPWKLFFSEPSLGWPFSIDLSPGNPWRAVQGKVKAVTAEAGFRWVQNGDFQWLLKASVWSKN